MQLSPPEIERLLALHAESLAVLREVRDYLLRLPAVPVNRDFAQRIDSFLNDPGQAGLRREAAMASDRQQMLVSGTFTAAGTPGLKVSLIQRRLRLELHEPESLSKKEEARVLSYLKEGMSLELEPATASWIAWTGRTEHKG